MKLTSPCRFSAYFQVAHAYLFGSQQGVKAYTRLDDTDIHALSDKISCVVDDNDKALLGMGSRVIIKYADGTVEDKAMPFPLGEPEHPVSPALIICCFPNLVCCHDSIFTAVPISTTILTLRPSSRGTLSSRSSEDACSPSMETRRPRKC
jgi:hypothetical protein